MIILFEYWNEVKNGTSSFAAVRDNFDSEKDTSYIIDRLHHHSPVYRQSLSINESGIAVLSVLLIAQKRKQISYIIMIVFFERWSESKRGSSSFSAIYDKFNAEKDTCYMIDTLNIKFPIFREILDINEHGIMFSGDNDAGSLRFNEFYLLFTKTQTH